MTTLKIKVTKEILERSKHCVATPMFTDKGAGANCAIALAVRDIFPLAWVASTDIHPFVFESESSLQCYTVFGTTPYNIRLPIPALYFIQKFDKATAEDRVGMEEIEFEIEVPDAVLEKINIDELRPLLENHPTLEFVS